VERLFLPLFLLFHFITTVFPVTSYSISFRMTGDVRFSARHWISLVLFPIGFENGGPQRLRR